MIYSTWFLAGKFKLSWVFIGGWQSGLMPKKYLQWWRDILKKLLSMQAGLQDEFQHKWAFILMMTLKCFKTIKNSNDEMALVNIKAQKCLNNLSFKKKCSEKNMCFKISICVWLLLPLDGGFGYGISVKHFLWKRAAPR